MLEGGLVCSIGEVYLGCHGFQLLLITVTVRDRVNATERTSLRFQHYLPPIATANAFIALHQIACHSR